MKLLDKKGEKRKEGKKWRTHISLEWAYHADAEWHTTIRCRVDQVQVQICILLQLLVCIKPAFPSCNLRSSWARCFCFGHYDTLHFVTSRRYLSLRKAKTDKHRLVSSVVLHYNSTPQICPSHHCGQWSSKRQPLNHDQAENTTRHRKASIHKLRSQF